MFPLTNPLAIFLVVLAIILLAPLLLNRIKVPYLVGLIVAGVAIGPHGFNILADDASFETFGQVGILYLMFLAAVEIDLYHLRRNLDQGLIFGLITSLVPMALGMLSSWLAFGVGWETGLLIGTMYASHTLISYPVVSRFGLGNSRSVVIAVSGTIVAVMVALVALALVADKTSGLIGPLATLGWIMLKLVAFCVVIGFSFRWLTRHFFRLTTDMVAKFIFVLALVVLASLISWLLGLEAILGAFYAGLVLNSFIPSRSALMIHIEFMGNAIFIPYFLLMVGMLINVRVVVEGWGVAWVGLNMIATALVAKWLCAWIGQHLFGFTRVGRMMLFGLTSGKAATTIAATMVGYQLGLLTEDMMNGAVLMILVCCVVSTVVTERAAKKRRISLTEDALKADKHHTYNHSRQLVAVSNPLTAESLMMTALYMRHPKNEYPVTALYIRNGDNPAAANVGRLALRKAVDAATDADVAVKDVERYDINVVSGLANMIKETDSTDIILGLHRKSNIVDSFYGSTVETLLGLSNRMLVITRLFAPVNTLRRIIVVVPSKAEYETGFSRWVHLMGNLATQLDCRIVFMAYESSVAYIRNALRTGGYEIRDEYRQIGSWDDFIMLSNEIGEDDLLVAVGARRTSISFSSDLENMPTFLSRYYSGQNIIVLYPEQFGDAAEPLPSLDMIAHAPSTNPSPLLLSITRLKNLFRIEK